VLPRALHLHFLSDLQQPRTQTLSVEAREEASPFKILVVVKNELLRLPSFPQRSGAPIL
jgi:hypothetical protein